MSMDMLPQALIDEEIKLLEARKAARLIEATEIIEDYFRNDTEGWARPYQNWRDRALKFLGRPTSKELLAMREDDRGKNRGRSDV